LNERENLLILDNQQLTNFLYRFSSTDHFMFYHIPAAFWVAMKALAAKNLTTSTIFS